MNFLSALSRRQFVQFGLAGFAIPALAAKLHSVVHGLHIGVQTFSLRGLRCPELITAIQGLGIAECELLSTQAEPTEAEAPDLAKWRTTVSLEYFKGIRKRFNQAGIEIYSYNQWLGAGRGPGAGGRNPNAGLPGAASNPAIGGREGGPTPLANPASQLSDAQIDRIFESAKALGAKNLCSGMSVDMAKRFAPFAEKHKIILAVSSRNPEVLPQIPAISPWLRMDFDIGDFTHAGRDALQFVKDNYEHLLDVHLKDSKLSGPSVPFGTGDAHMKEVLQFLAGKKTQVRAMIDCDYPGTGTSIDEVKKCYEYVKSCLA